MEPEDEVGYVVEVTGNTARVEMDDTEECAGCSAKARCFSGREGKRVIDAWDPLGVMPNQQVRVRWDERARFKATLIVYALPLAGLVLGAWGGSQLARRIGQSDAVDFWAAGSAFLSLILCFLLIRFLNRRVEGRPGYLPAIVQIVEQKGQTLQDGRM